MGRDEAEMLMKGVSRQVKLPGKGTQESEEEALGQGRSTSTKQGL